MLSRPCFILLGMSIALLTACGTPAPAATLPLPTSTPIVTPIPQLTPEQPGALPGLVEIADPPGEAYPWARFTRTPRLALHPLHGHAAGRVAQLEPRR